MPTNLREIVDGALRIVGEVAGSGAQVFSDDRAMEDAIRIFDFLYKKRFWEQYTKWTTVTLDGTTGVATTNAFSDVRDFDDIRAVHQNGKATPLPTLPSTLNPNTLTTGTTPRYWSSLHVSHSQYLTRRVKIYPVTSTGQIDVNARHHPVGALEAGWAWLEPEIHLDKQMLEYGTAFMILSWDGMNAGAADVARNMMEERYKDVMKSLANQPIRGSSNNNDFMTQWQEYP